MIEIEKFRRHMIIQPPQKTGATVVWLKKSDIYASIIHQKPLWAECLGVQSPANRSRLQVQHSQQETQTEKHRTKESNIPLLLFPSTSVLPTCSASSTTIKHPKKSRRGTLECQQRVHNSWGSGHCFAGSILFTVSYEQTASKPPLEIPVNCTSRGPCKTPEVSPAGASLSCQNTTNCLRHRAATNQFRWRK